MIKIPKFYKNTYFWGCLHLQHERDFILGPRGFKTASEAKAEIFTRQNQSMNSNDTLFLLGDTVVGAGYNGLAEWEDIFNRFHFSKLFFCAGNHGAGIADVLNKYGSSDCEYEFAKKINHYRDIYYIPNYYELKIGNDFCVLSHYPILSFNKASHNATHFFAHVHNSLGNSELGSMYLKKMRAQEVSVEVCPYPISFTQAKINFFGKENQSPDHHN